jgi:hypothetical protein
LGGCGLDSSCSGYEPVTGSCELGNEYSGSIKGGKFLQLVERLLASQRGLRSMELLIIYTQLFSWPNAYMTWSVTETELTILYRLFKKFLYSIKENFYFHLHLKRAAYCVVAPCSQVEVYRSFRGAPLKRQHTSTRLHSATT